MGLLLQLTTGWDGRSENTSSQLPKASGQAHLADSRPGSGPCPLGWLRPLPPRRQRRDGRTQEPSRPPHHPARLAGCFLSKDLTTKLDRTGAGGPRGASPGAACGPCLRLPPPRPNHNLQHLNSFASHGPNQTEMGRQQQGDKIEGGLSCTIFQSPQTHSGAKNCTSHE